MQGVDNLQGATMRFTTFVGGWANDSDMGSGLSKADADTIAGHVDLVVRTRDPHVPLLLVPEDSGEVERAFDHLDAFVRSWPADRVDKATGLSRADLDLVVATRGQDMSAPRGDEPPDGPPDIFDGGETLPHPRSNRPFEGA